MIAVCMCNCLSDDLSMRCVFVCVCVNDPERQQWPRNDLNGHSCISMATGCFNGGTLWAREQGNDRSGRRNALILSPWREGMLPLSDGLIAPALIDRQPGPLRSPGNIGPPLPHTHTHTLETHNSAFLTLTVLTVFWRCISYQALPYYNSAFLTDGLHVSKHSLFVMEI